MRKQQSTLSESDNRQNKTTTKHIATVTTRTSARKCNNLPYTYLIDTGAARLLLSLYL